MHLAHAFCAAFALAAFGFSPQARAYTTHEDIAAPVPSGGAIKIGPYSSLDLKCNVSSVAHVSIMRNARKGRLSVVRGSGDPNYPAGSKYAHCNDKIVSGNMLRYAPLRGRSGPDQFTYMVRFEDGERRVISVNVEIR